MYIQSDGATLSGSWGWGGEMVGGVRASQCIFAHFSWFSSKIVTNFVWIYTSCPGVTAYGSDYWEKVSSGHTLDQRIIVTRTISHSDNISDMNSPFSYRATKSLSFHSDRFQSPQTCPQCPEWSPAHRSTESERYGSDTTKNFSSHIPLPTYMVREFSAARDFPLNLSYVVGLYWGALCVSSFGSSLSFYMTQWHLSWWPAGIS